MKTDKNLLKRAYDLINTSVDDMLSGLYNYTKKDLPVLNKALEIAKRRQEITKVKHLQRHIKKVEKGELQS